MFEVLLAIVRAGNMVVGAEMTFRVFMNTLGTVKLTVVSTFAETRSSPAHLCHPSVSPFLLDLSYVLEPNSNYSNTYQGFSTHFL